MTPAGLENSTFRRPGTTYFFRWASEHFQKACPPDNHYVLSQKFNISKGKRSLRHGSHSNSKSAIVIVLAGMACMMFIPCILVLREREREMFYLTTHSTHFIYGYMASDIWLRTILIVRKETRCRHIGYSYRLTARVLLYAPSHRQDNTYHGLCYTSRGALAGTRNSSMGPPHEGSIRRPTAP